MGRFRLWLSMCALLGAASLLGAGCKGSTARLGPGEECTSSTECEPGLLCDLGVSPPVCSGELTEPPDAGPDAPPEPADADLRPDGPPMPDAPPGMPDAAPMADAPPPMIDAAPPPVDAAVPVIDAAVPDVM